MKLFHLIIYLSGLIIITGCDHLARDGNLSRYYQPYTGVQTNWPISSTGGGFVTTFKEFTIYHGLPPVPYTVVGRFDRPNIPLFRVAKCARYHHANAIFMSEEDVIQYHTDNGMTFGNGRIAITTPSTTKAEKRTQATAYLIVITGAPIPDQKEPPVSPRRR